MQKDLYVEIDGTGRVWERTMETILTRSARIIVLRGAGSFNGISVPDANKVLSEQLIPRMESYLEIGRASVIFDGDNDDLGYPDIGYIMGRLRDHFGDRADFYAVQMLSWYRYRNELPELRPLHSASDNKYRTILFPENAFLGDHSYFSQHKWLVRSEFYEQWYVGACGAIASMQLADYNDQASGSLTARRAVVFRLPVSKEQERKILAKIAETKDEEKRTRLVKSLEQRQANPYGLLCTPEGDFIAKSEYKNLHIEVV
jgi:hypothetical protein